MGDKGKEGCSDIKKKKSICSEQLFSQRHKVQPHMYRSECEGRDWTMSQTPVKDVYLTCIGQWECVVITLTLTIIICVCICFKVLKYFHKCTIIPTKFYLKDLTQDFPEIFDSLCVSHTQTRTDTHTLLHTQFQPRSSIQQGRNTGLTL